jgi:hypothetical protein
VLLKTPKSGTSFTLQARIPSVLLSEIWYKADAVRNSGVGSAAVNYHFLSRSAISVGKNLSQIRNSTCIFFAATFWFSLLLNTFHGIKARDAFLPLKYQFLLNIHAEYAHPEAKYGSYFNVDIRCHILFKNLDAGPCLVRATSNASHSLSSLSHFLRRSAAQAHLVIHVPFSRVRRAEQLDVQHGPILLDAQTLFTLSLVGSVFSASSGTYPPYLRLTSMGDYNSHIANGPPSDLNWILIGYLPNLALSDVLILHSTMIAV